MGFLFPVVDQESKRQRVLHDLSNYQKVALKEDVPIRNILIMMQIQDVCRFTMLN